MRRQSRTSVHSGGRRVRILPSPTARLCHRCHGKLVLLHPVGRQALTLGGGAEHDVFGVRFVPGRPYRRSKNPARLAGGTAVASTSLVGASLWHALSLAFVLSALDAPQAGTKSGGLAAAA